MMSMLKQEDLLVIFSKKINTTSKETLIVSRD